MKKEKSLPAGPLRRIEASRRGFTLIEILIVIAIIMLLFLIVLASIRNQINKTFDVERKSDLFKMQKSLEEYYNDHQTYLTDAAPVSDCGSTSTVLSPYLSKIPCDPTTKTPYVYIVPTPPATAEDGYVLCARLDNQADPDIIRIGCDPVEGCGWQAGYNYCLTSGMPVTTTGYVPPVGTISPTPTGTPTPSINPVWHFACGRADFLGNSYCGVFDDPVAAGCRKTYQNSNCDNECQAHPEFRCDR